MSIPCAASPGNSTTAQCCSAGPHCSLRAEHLHHAEPPRVWVGMGMLLPFPHVLPLASEVANMCDSVR